MPSGAGRLEASRKEFDRKHQRRAAPYRAARRVFVCAFLYPDIVFYRFFSRIGFVLTDLLRQKTPKPVKSSSLHYLSCFYRCIHFHKIWEEHIYDCTAGKPKRAAGGFPAQAGVLPHDDAYWELLEAMALLEQSPQLLASVHKLVYAEIARRCGCSASGVEKAIRVCVHKRWVEGALAPLRPYLRKPDKRPTNSEFLSALMIWYAYRVKEGD